MAHITTTTLKFKEEHIMSKKNQKKNLPIGTKERPEDRAQRVREEAGRFKSRIVEPKKGGAYKRQQKHRSQEGAYRWFEHPVKGCFFVLRKEAFFQG